MKVLWLCNVMIPMIAEQLNLEGTNKEGWISGLADMVLKNQQSNGVDLAVAFPAPQDLFSTSHDAGSLREQPESIYKRVLKLKNGTFTCYGFYEDVGHAERYDRSLENKLALILDDAKPDIVHCFGTEYPHTLAMCRVFSDKKRLLINVQGICTLCAQAYFADLPGKVLKKVTLRDYLKRDCLLEQQQKFVKRGIMEKEAVMLSGNVAGRTEWDRDCIRSWNKNIRYFNMNEILRPEFYGPKWKADKCIPHSIFLSQGDYPLKGLHYMLLAMPAILSGYPDAHLYVAGNSIVNYRTLKQKLKISSYGKYLRKLMKENGLYDKVSFLGRLNAEQMRERYLISSLFVCCSSVENSPNSLGEAMLLGMPCVTANVGGIPSLFTDGEDGIMYEGHRDDEDGIMYEVHRDGGGGTMYVAHRDGRDGTIHENRRIEKDSDEDLKNISRHLSEAVIAMWSDQDKQQMYCKNARQHAGRTHCREKNYSKLIEIYGEILSGGQSAADEYGENISNEQPAADEYDENNIL